MLTQNGAAQLGGFELRAAGHSVRLCANALIGRFFLGDKSLPARWAGTLLIVAGTMLVGLGSPHTGRRAVTAWLLLAIIVGITVMADLLQSQEMKRHGEIQDFRPTRLGRFWRRWR